MPSLSEEQRFFPTLYWMSACLQKSLDSFRNWWEVFIVQNICLFFFCKSTKICIMNQKEKVTPQSFLLGRSASYLSKGNGS